MHVSVAQFFLIGLVMAIFYFFCSKTAIYVTEPVRIWKILSGANLNGMANFVHALQIFIYSYGKKICLVDRIGQINTRT